MTIATATAILLILFTIHGVIAEHPVLLPFRRIAVFAVPYLLVCLWVYLQSVSWTPTALHHPAWQAASAGIEEALVSSISIAPFDSIDQLIRMLCYAGIFWLALQICRESRNAEMMTRLFIAAASIYAIYGLSVEFSGSKSILWFEKLEYRDNLTSTFRYKNAYATFAGFGLILTMLALVDGINRRTSSAFGPRESMRVAILWITEKGWQYLLAAALIFSSLVLSDSRGGLIFSIIATIFALFVYRMAAGRKIPYLMLIDAARNLPAPIKRVRVHWEDAEFDTRQGETKTASVHVSPILDVFPHIWSIIRTVGVIPPLKYAGIHIDPNSGAVTVDLTDDAAHVSTSYSATINRQGTARKRIVEILCWDGSVNEIDFSVEPGTVTLDGTSFAALWDPGNPPLDQEIETFLQALTGADLDERIDAGKSAECFELTTLAETQFEKTETELIIESLRASVHMGLAARLTGEKLLREAAKNRIRLDIGGPDAKKLGQAIFNDISGIGNPVTINGSEAWAFYRDSTLKSSLQAGLNGAEPKIRDHETKDRIS